MKRFLIRIWNNNAMPNPISIAAAVASTPFTGFLVSTASCGTAGISRTIKPGNRALRMWRWRFWGMNILMIDACVYKWPEYCSCTGEGPECGDIRMYLVVRIPETRMGCHR